MHVVSFYSFKGGVGRTMALVNVGYELARLGRNVLLVDFDLEAPGLSSYEPFASQVRTSGLVEYVAEYLQTGQAPDVRNFVMRYEGKGVDVAVPLWLMPAGRQDAAYVRKLASINWTDLYAARSGYLLFEDLRQQWAAMEERFDYVLVDSRTGLTDVAGICTRQIPDAVCLMFLPNDQNIDGMSLVVEEIREGRMRDKATRLMFCPSNVPFLDDEFEILKGKLDKAEERLGFEQVAATIHRYDSMALIDQGIFVRDRPTTRLSLELRKLAKALMRGNLRDREGALAELVELRRQLRGRRSDLPRSDAVGKSFLTSATDHLKDIRTYHPTDGEIGWSLAGVYHLLGDITAEVDALSIAIDQNYRVNEARSRRGTVLMALGRKSEAVEDLNAVVASPETAAIDLWAALEGLQETDADWLDALKASKALERLADDDRLRFSHLLKSDVGALPTATDIADHIRTTSNDVIIRRNAETELSLSLIGSGEFKRVMDILGPSREAVLASKSITRSFNYAMAEWGHTGRPDEDILRHTLELASDWRGDDPNFEQCIALCYAVVGETTAALDHATRARKLVGPGSVFSAWRYLRVTSQQMLADLDALVDMVRSGTGEPAFLQRQKHR